MSTTQVTQVTAVTINCYLCGSKGPHPVMFLECFEACQVSELITTFDQMNGPW